MVYEDYEPYDKDKITADGELPFGDYPKLEKYGEWSRDPQADYDVKTFKRNYGEPMHIFYDLYMSPRYDISYKPQTPYWLQGVILFGTFFSFVGGFALCEYYDIRFTVAKVPSEKQFPYQGKVHYTFEPAE
ncbi:NADH dehydrogenase [ubiquinone] 1 beta subcomplex subunit 8, mitochondrial [Galendromus occidentalis]|uniref:NADH dehydrogenase [ubiquinone] 1 beta subcomplex subunit 8, mitochondrial n=1 Tax=Galendromus occidentalis TaxID=34638 RepID=A0AAJ6QR36_9ACAR|nr:NADH dehydrogenase [ubiquinone] 1 beta subcomplex subunit 8, mitochondrial [Galendromus occidentalis]